MISLLIEWHFRLKFFFGFCFNDFHFKPYSIEYYTAPKMLLPLPSFWIIKKFENCQSSFAFVFFFSFFVVVHASIFSAAPSPLFCFPRKTCYFSVLAHQHFVAFTWIRKGIIFESKKEPKSRRSNKQVGWLLEGHCKGVLWHKTIFRYVDFKSFHLGWMGFFIPFIPFHSSSLDRLLRA